MNYNVVVFKYRKNNDNYRYGIEIRRSLDFVPAEMQRWNYARDDIDQLYK